MTDDLTARATQLLRVVVWHPGADFELDAISTGTALSPTELEPVLGELVDASLVSRIGDHRYRLLDPVGQLHRVEPTECDRLWRNGIFAMIDWYPRRTCEADLMLNPLPPRFSAVYREIDSSRFADPTTAMEWFAEERTNVMAAQDLAIDLGNEEADAALAEALWNPLRLSYAVNDLIASQVLGSLAARNLDDPHREALFRLRAGFGLSAQGDRQTAVRQCTLAYDLCLRVGDLWLCSAALTARSRALHDAGDPTEAIRDVRSSLDLAEQLGDQSGIALRLRQLGMCFAALDGGYDRAAEFLGRSANMMARLGDRTGQGRALTELDEVHLAAGNRRTRPTPPPSRRSNSDGHPDPRGASQPGWPCWAARRPQTAHAGKPCGTSPRPPGCSTGSTPSEASWLRCPSTRPADRRHTDPARRRRNKPPQRRARWAEQTPTRRPIATTRTG